MSKLDGTQTLHATMLLTTLNIFLLIQLYLSYFSNWVFFYQIFIYLFMYFELGLTLSCAQSLFLALDFSLSIISHGYSDKHAVLEIYAVLTECKTSTLWAILSSSFHFYFQFSTNYQLLMSLYLTNMINSYLTISPFIR